MQKNDLGIVLVGHGSKVADANQAVEKVRDSMVQVTGLRIESAFLQLAKPTVDQAAATLIKKGCKKLIFLPYFLYEGQHVSSDLPQIVASLAQKWPLVKFQLAPPVGKDSRLVSILVDKVMAHSKLLNGQEIEELSLSLVAQLTSLPKDKLQRDVTARVVHATGDLLIANQLLFAPDFFTKAINYLKQNNFVIVTDVKMTAAAISTSLLPSAAKVVCALEYQVKTDSRKLSNGTRSQQAIRNTLTTFPEAAVVIGNAPTALEELLQMFALGLIKPPFIVGVPVGFVGAHQAKKRLSESKTAYATLLGTRGGSAIAGAIVNALLKIVQKEKC